MGKYSLITTLTLNAAGYNDGINQAKAKTKQFAEGVQTAGNTVKNSFSPLVDMMGGVGTKMSGLWNIGKGGASAFKSMIPAITGVKTALISSGIGAIVVALGTAFAALSSYLTGTVDGADTLNKVLGYVKGTFSAILGRVKALGSGLVKLFTGDFKGAAEEMQKAFKGGLLDEIQEKAEANLDIAKRENQLKKDKITMEYEFLDLENKISSLKEQSKNTEKYTATQRLELIRQAEELERSLGNKKISLAQQEYQLVKDKNALSSKTYDNMQSELDAYKNLSKTQTDLNNKLKEYNSEKKEVIAQSKTELINAEKLKKLQEQALTKKFESAMIKPVIEITYKPTLLPLSENDTKNQEEEAKRRVEMAKAEADAETFSKSVGDILSQGVSGMIGDFASGLGTMLGGGKVDFGKMILGGLISMAEALGRLAISIGITVDRLKSLLLKYPKLAVIAGVALLATAAYAKQKMSSTAKFATGGIVGGSSYYGDRVPAMVNSGEMILNGKQQKNLFDMINKGGSNGIGDYQLLSTLKGSDIQLALVRTNQKINSRR